MRGYLEEYYHRSLGRPAPRDSRIGYLRIVVIVGRAKGHLPVFIDVPFNDMSMNVSVRCCSNVTLSTRHGWSDVLASSARPDRLIRTTEVGAVWALCVMPDMCQAVYIHIPGVYLIYM